MEKKSPEGPSDAFYLHSKRFSFGPISESPKFAPEKETNSFEDLEQAKQDLKK